MDCKQERVMSAGLMFSPERTLAFFSARSVLKMLERGNAAFCQKICLNATDLFHASPFAVFWQSKHC